MPSSRAHRSLIPRHPRRSGSAGCSDEAHDRDDDPHEHEEDDRRLHPDPQRVHGGASLVAAPLTPRARAILVAVEREVTARLGSLEDEVAEVAPSRAEPIARPAPELLLALEL